MKIPQFRFFLVLLSLFFLFNQSYATTQNWTMFQHFINHTAWDGVAYPLTPGLDRATFNTGGFVQSSPIIQNGYVYVGSNDAQVYQLNATNITQKINNFTTGAEVKSSPAFADGYLYIGSNDGNLYQLNATNLQEVNYFTTGAQVVASPVIADGYVYIGSEDANIYQLNATNISIQIHNFTAGDEVWSTGAIDNGYLYVGSNDGYLYQLNATNISQQINSYDLGNTILRSSPAVTNGFVYIAAQGSGVFQLNATNVSRYVANFSTSEGGTYDSPAVTNGYVYIGGLYNQIYQLNAANISGSFDNPASYVALFNTDGDIQGSPTVANGYVYFGDKNGFFYQLDASNISIQIANLTVGRNVVSTPSVSSAYVYFGSNDGNVYQVNASDISLATYSGCVNLSDGSTFQHKLDGDLEDGFGAVESFILCPGNYTSNANTVLTFGNNDVTMDCDGANIFSGSATYGVYSEFNNTRIINCNFRQFVFSSIYFAYSHSMSIENVYADDGAHGIFFIGINDSNITNSTGLGVGDYGIQIHDSNGISIINSSAIDGLRIINSQNILVNNVFANASGMPAISVFAVPDLVIDGCSVISDYYSSAVLVNAPRASMTGCSITNIGEDGYALSLSDTTEELRTDNGTFSGNSFMSLGEGETVAVGLAEVATGGNLFYNNILQADVWVSSSVDDENYFNNSEMGNKYYLKDGTPSWGVYDINDIDNDGWADSGSDLPFSESLSGGVWSGIDVDWHPYVGMLISSPSESGSSGSSSKKVMGVSLSPSCTVTKVTVTENNQPITQARIYLSSADFVGYTNEKGELQVPSCGNLRLEISKENFLPIDSVFSAACVCSGLTNQPNNSSGNAVVPVKPTTPVCTKDSDCSTQEVCQSNICVAKQTNPQCTQDSDCGRGQICDSGSCKPQAPILPQIDISAPPGSVGQPTIVTVLKDGFPCKNCELSITDSSGKTIKGTTDANGKFIFTPLVSGTYTVSLFENGLATKTQTSQITPAVETLKPAVYTTDYSLCIFVIILILVICGASYWYVRVKNPNS